MKSFFNTNTLKTTIKIAVTATAGYGIYRFGKHRGKREYITEIAESALSKALDSELVVTTRSIVAANKFAKSNDGFGAKKIAIGDYPSSVASN